MKRSIIWKIYQPVWNFVENITRHAAGNYYDAYVYHVIKRRVGNPRAAHEQKC